MARVVTSDRAVELVTRLRTDVDRVREALDTMLRTGEELTQPQVWEGAAANRFRDGSWAETRSWAATSVQQLADLQATVEQVTRSIEDAGGGLG